MICLDRGLANDSLQAKSAHQAASVSKVLLERGHTIF